MRGIGGSTLRGGQTVFHGLRMWGQLFKAAIMLGAFMAVAVPAWNLWRSTTGYEWYAAGMYTLAEMKLAFGYDPKSGQEVRAPGGSVQVLTIRDIAASAPAWRIRERIKAEMFASAWLGAKAGLGIIAAFLAWFWYRGVQLGRRRRIRGAELVSAAELRRRVQPAHLRALGALPGSGRLRPYRIAGIPYPERTETQHTIVSGTTGSGKTVLISDLVAQIRASFLSAQWGEVIAALACSPVRQDAAVTVRPGARRSTGAGTGWWSSTTTWRSTASSAPAMSCMARPGSH